MYSVCVIRASVKVQLRPNVVVLANWGRFGLEPGFQARAGLSQYMKTDEVSEVCRLRTGC